MNFSASLDIHYFSPVTFISEFTIIQTLNFFLITKSMQENPIGYRVDRGIDPSIRK